MHTDVGGGYRDKELSDIVLEWMVQHAVRRGLRLYNNKEEERTHTCKPNPNGTLHDSRDKYWKRKVFKAKPRYWKWEACFTLSLRLKS